jgi:hypothetical protein
MPILGVLVVLFSGCGVASQPVATATASPHLQIATYSATARVQTGKVTAVSVSCKPGEQMLGGGFRSSDLFEYAAFIDASYPSSATTWTVTAAPAPSFSVEADVYCFPAMVPSGIQIVRATGSPAGRVACPQSTVLLSGGYQSSQPIGVSHPHVFVNDIGGQFLIRIGARDSFEQVTDNQIWGPCDNEKGNHLAFC